MRTLPFLALYVVTLLALLGLRFALPAQQAAVQRAADAVRTDAVMAVPPKPRGLAGSAGAGSGAGGVLTSAHCQGMAEQVRDVCWQALARQTADGDPDAALAVCARIADAELGPECVADVAEVAAPRDRPRAEAICGTVARTKWRGQCRFGVGLALAEVAPEQALAECEHAEAFRDFCRHDVVGTVALVHPDAAVAFCAREEGDALTRKTCWHGIGKYLARRSLDEAAAACGRATPEWRGNCVHGVGWGAAERDPDAALAGCSRLDDLADHCRQGVAHQLKRSDPERALALCAALGDTALRDRCTAFVRR